VTTATQSTAKRAAKRAAKPATQRATRRATPPSPERNREATSQRILAAVGEVLARDGFGAMGVNAIAKEAGVDKVLIYRYFGGLPELLQAWGDSGRFWPSVQDLVRAEPGLLKQPAAERYARFFEHFIDALRARPLTLAILAAEITERNELTAILEAEREAWGEEATQVLGGRDFTQAHLPGVTVLLVAGVQYLLLRARHVRQFGGFDLQSDAGWDALKLALRTLASQLFDVDKVRPARRRHG
jgi:AcrR family transcriptional regulator